jgi:Amt family ammonium transporter
MDINAGDTAWLLASSALVLLMTPGLAFFYGGLTRAKSTLNMMMMSFVTIGIISILWALYGFTLAFGATGSASATSPDPSNGLWGHLSWDGLATAATTTFGAQGDQVPTIVFAAFQLISRSSPPR